ncbi:hypothetical protein BOX15_Mlig028592g1 [Macrostomum lignano]|uniref:Uncharacterized protein n=1 Tax=Macrostomum lignano TaxID=282301 RepID=A0A267EZH9_9PLAT|nr:hypothetical protein BOX15_Mlig028592g1 [Macrostomum lignano]
MNFGPVYFNGRGAQLNRTLVRSDFSWRLHKDLEWTVGKLSLEKKLNVHRGPVNSVCWSSTGQQLLTGSDDRNLVISTPFHSEPKGETIFSGHQANIFSAKFLPHTDDQKVASAAGNGRVSLIDLGVADGLEVARSFASHLSAVFDLVTSQWEAGVFFSVSGDGTIRQFDVREAHCGCSLLLGNQHCSLSGYTAAALHPISAGRRLFVATRDGEILEFDRRRLPSAEPVWLSRTAQKSAGSNFRISSLEFDHSGHRLLASYAGGSICLFDVAAGSSKDAEMACSSSSPAGYALLREYRGHRNSRTCIQQATFWGSEHILSGSDCGHLMVWRISDSSLIAARQADQCLVNRVAAHPQLLCLATSGMERDVKIWSPMQHGEDAGQRDQSDLAYATELARRNQQMLGCSDLLSARVAAMPNMAVPPPAGLLEAGLLPS